VTRVGIGLSVVLAAACPAAAGHARPVASLSASPARVALAGAERTTVTLRNFGPSRLMVKAAAGGVKLDTRGRPKLLGRAGGRARNAATWLVVRPRALAIAPGGAAVIEVASRIPRSAQPGDHHAVVLFATRTVPSRGVAVRMRLGIRVVVRAPGRIVRQLVVRELRVRRARRSRVLEVVLANRGNATETLPRGRVTVTLRARGRTVARLRVGPREVLPRSKAILVARYVGRVRGVVFARVEVSGARTRIFRVRL
jgi:hypothetical protein